MIDKNRGGAPVAPPPGSATVYNYSIVIVKFHRLNVSM